MNTTKTRAARRRRGAFSGLVLTALLASAMPARAEMCALDNVPAATLLLPYFEVDYTHLGAVNTLVRVQNATAEGTLMHVTTWTQWSQPTVDFDVYLTGYDAVAWSLIDMFNGNIPITADRQSDPTDTISPHGEYPEWEADFPVCSNFFPFFVNPVIRGMNLERVQKGHTGQPLSSIGGRCLGPNLGDNVGRGYITIDVVGQCSTSFPFDAGYFVDGGLGVALDANRVFGDWQIIDPARGVTYGGPLVSIEANGTFNADAVPTGYTFYGTQTNAADDNREPLVNTWDFRFAAGATAADPFTSTELIVWRDTTSFNYPNNGFDCTTGSTFTPLEEQQVVCYDEQENAVELCGVGTPCFPLATQKVAFDQGSLALPYSRGFCRVNLNNPGDSPVGDRDFSGATGPTVQQSHLTSVRFGTTGIGGSATGTPILHACTVPPVP